MNFGLEKVDKLSGSEASVYAVTLAGQPSSVFEQFLAEYQVDYLPEVKDIINRLRVIGHKTGAREQFFKPFEGKYGDLVCALYDDPDKKLRLYCMRFGGDCVILGGGGPKEVQAWQDDPNLTYHAELMIKVAKKVHKRFEDGDLKWASGFKDINGDLTFMEDDDE
ncbi:hypothetical protein BDD43_4292 [Mucilaginibacter gracilis]|uniref:Uncharacterized protein n=1 Tax=Mucilaginibacter gracilis TaxID=423350 RepID=A0A495J6M4_9SPHI|nr:hypothetical protein [Mucilaginibacter gracilis]RKR84068.1 hypothetical protein BDD43_4292 [Mucilaginibacter gracilis]